MARVLITPRARLDVDEAIAALGLPPDAWSRVVRSLRLLEEFPLAGRELEGRWTGIRFVIGPWPWMLLLYVFESADDEVRVIAVHDARASSAATHG